jgi:hypothetical protein
MVNDSNFDPDAYIAAKTAPTGGFDPDAYIAAKTASDPKGGVPTQVDTDPTGAQSMAFERSPEYPNSRMTDPTIADVGMVQGIAGLAKGAAGLGLRGAGAALNAVPATENIVPTIGNTANDMLLKSMGARGTQIKAMGGLEEARDAANVAREAGMDKVFSTEIGRRNALENTIAQHGEEIGNLRKQAGPASPNILDQVAQNLTKKYNPANADVYSSEAKDIPQALSTIRGTNVPLTNADISQGITKLNKYNTGARTLQPTNALSDVANQTSAANDVEIIQKLGPVEGQKYLEALNNESGGFKLKAPFERGAERLAIGAQGMGGGMLGGLTKRIMNAGGYRAASKGLNSLYEGMNETPNLAPTGRSALEAYLAKKREEQP